MSDPATISESTQAPMQDSQDSGFVKSHHLNCTVSVPTDPREQSIANQRSNASIHAPSTLRTSSQLESRATDAFEDPPLWQQLQSIELPSATASKKTSSRLRRRAGTLHLNRKADDRSEEMSRHARTAIQPTTRPSTGSQRAGHPERRNSTWDGVKRRPSIPRSPASGYCGKRERRNSTWAGDKDSTATVRPTPAAWEGKALVKRPSEWDLKLDRGVSER